jgi:hypothetical protein
MGPFWACTVELCRSIEVGIADAGQIKARTAEISATDLFVFDDRFCRKRFYGDNELYNHMQQVHEVCFICRRNRPDKFLYYRDYTELEGIVVPYLRLALPTCFDCTQAYPLAVLPSTSSGSKLNAYHT